MAKLSKFIDTSKCTACRACQVACKAWNELPAEKNEYRGVLQNTESTTPKTFTYVSMEEKLENGKVDWVFAKRGCFHCTDAACEKACPQKAISHTETGAVVRDLDKCIGCGYCVQYCPFGMAKVDEAQKKMFKCHLCSDRVANNLDPACAKTCVPDAISFGDRAEQVAMAKARLEVVKKQYPNANIYGLDEQFLGGTNVFYLLTEKPEFYGLPQTPVVPASLNVWQNGIRPVGSALPIAAAGAVLFSMFMGRVNKVRHAEQKSHDKGGSIDG